MPSTNGPFQEIIRPGKMGGMNTSDHSSFFFAKPSFHASPRQEVLPVSARRALAAFDQGYRFSASFFPSVATHLSYFNQEAPRFQPAPKTSSPAEGLSAVELDRLLERNLLPRF